MLIISFFTDGGTPKTGLSPTIDVWEDDGTQVVTAQVMTEIAGGFYKYDFVGYNSSKNYSIRSDGGATLSGNERYNYGVNDFNQITDETDEIKELIGTPDSGEDLVSILGDIQTETDKIQTIDDNVDDILTDTNEIQGKLPDNYIMGSSVTTDKDDEIDTILASIGTLGSGIDLKSILDDILTDTSEIQGKLPNNNIMGSSDKTDKDDEIDAIKSTIDTNLDTTISSRSSHNPEDIWTSEESGIGRTLTEGTRDTEIDSIKSTIDTNLDAKVSSRSSHSVSDVWTHATRTLTSFGTLIADIWSYATRTLTSFGTLITDIWSSDESGIGRTLTEGTKDSEIDAIKAKTDNLPVDPTSETNATSNKDEIVTEVDANETKIDAIQTDLDNPNQYKADVSGLATEANATSNKNDIISEIDDNEAKIDSIITTLSTLISDIWSYGTRTLTSFGSLVSDIWNNAVRTLTSFGSLKDDVADQVWDETLSEHQNVGSTGKALEDADATADPSAVADAVWDEAIADHQGAGSTGKSLSDAEAGSSPSAIAEAVWNELTNGSGSDSFGDLIKRIAGLCQENYRIINPSYDASNNLISGTIKIYPSASDVDTDTNAIAQYTITASYNASGNMTGYKVKKA